MLKHTLLLPFLFLGLFLNAQTTVVDIVVGSDDHNTLEAAVVAAELADDLSGDGPFTLFAPTDAAFEALPEGTVETLLADPTGDLADILLYHALGAEVLSTSLVAEQTVTMLNGDEATVTVMDSTVMINGVATVISADLTADNGVVHVIDAVLLPPADVETNTVADIIAGSTDHFVLNSVLDSTGLDEVLAGEGPFTVFAPVDAAFDAIPPFVLLDLLTNNEALTEILTYHVANGNVPSSDLSDGQTITTVNGEDVTVSIMGTTVMINDATVIVADLVADNGVVHVIDVVLNPPAPTPSTVVDIIVNSPDHNLLELAVGAAGLVDALSAEGPFTVFAPTDAAIGALVAALDITADELLALEGLGDILKYHVVGAAALSTDLSDGQLLTTLQGGDVEISTNAGVMVNDANVIMADLVADNGVVHVIDAVLSLPSGVEQVELTELFNVYPNPTVDAIRWHGVQVDRLQVVDAQGRTRIETTNPTNTIDLSSLESGLFYLVIESDGQRAVKSVLKH